MSEMTVSEYVESLMGIEEVRLSFEKYADDKGFDMSIDFFNMRGDANPYTEQDTRLAYEIWCNAVHSTNLMPLPNSTGAQ